MGRQGQPGRAPLEVCAVTGEQVRPPGKGKRIPRPALKCFGAGGTDGNPGGSFNPRPGLPTLLNHIPHLLPLLSPTASASTPRRATPRVWRQGQGWRHRAGERPSVTPPSHFPTPPPARKLPPSLSRGNLQGQGPEMQQITPPPPASPHPHSPLPASPVQSQAERGPHTWAWRWGWVPIRRGGRGRGPGSQLPSLPLVVLLRQERFGRPGPSLEGPGSPLCRRGPGSMVGQWLSSTLVTGPTAGGARGLAVGRTHWVSDPQGPPTGLMTPDR